MTASTRRKYNEMTAQLDMDAMSKPVVDDHVTQELRLRAQFNAEHDCD